MVIQCLSHPEVSVLSSHLLLLSRPRCPKSSSTGKGLTVKSSQKSTNVVSVASLEKRAEESKKLQQRIESMITDAEVGKSLKHVWGGVTG